MANFALDVDDDGVAVITFDMADRRINTVTSEVQAELLDLVERLGSDDAIRAAILRSGKPGSFCVGADLIELEEEFAGWRAATTQEALRAGVDTAGRYGRALRALELCGKPVAAAVDGLALGGGLELMLACRVRVAADTPALQLALPETSIGLMPGAGATQRLPRMMGIAAALPHLIEGRPIEPAAALEQGVLDAIVSSGELIDECKRRLRHAPAVAPWDAQRFVLPQGGPHGAGGMAALGLATARLAGERGAFYPGHANTLRAIYEGVQVPIDAGLRIESRFFFNTARSLAAEVMVRTLFHARQAHGRSIDEQDAEALTADLRKAWSSEGAALAAEGISPAIVAGIARTLGGWPVDVSASEERELEQPGKGLVERISERFLRAGTEAAERWRDTRPSVAPAWVNFVAVRDGYPAWTGGPLSGHDRKAKRRHD